MKNINVYYTFNEYLDDFTTLVESGNVKDNRFYPILSLLNEFLNKEETNEFKDEILFLTKFLDKYSDLSTTPELADLYKWLPFDSTAEDEYKTNILYDLFALLVLRYGDEYLPARTKELEKINNKYQFDENESNWAKKFIGILQMTADKYLNILQIYSNNIDKLMNPLTTHHTSERVTDRNEDYDTDVSGKNIYNDTPQTTDIVATMEDNQYASELSKSTAHTDNSGEIDETVDTEDNTEVDPETTMARIKEIQDSFDNVLKRWSNEFSGLFLEEI